MLLTPLEGGHKVFRFWKAGWSLQESGCTPSGDSGVLVFWTSPLAHRLSSHRFLWHHPTITTQEAMRIDRYNHCKQAGPCCMEGPPFAMSDKTFRLSEPAPMALDALEVAFYLYEQDHMKVSSVPRQQCQPVIGKLDVKKDRSGQNARRRTQTSRLQWSGGQPACPQSG